MDTTTGPRFVDPGVTVLNDPRIKARLRDRAYGFVDLWWIQALRNAGAGVLARDVLVVLASYADKDGAAYPSIAAIAETLNVGTRAVKAAIGELKAAGIIRVTVRNRRNKESNLYQLAKNRQEVQGNGSATYSPPHQVHDSNTYKGGLGARIEPDQVNDSCKNQVRDLSTKAASNVPVEHTNDVRTLSEKEGENHERLAALLKRCGFSNGADQEAIKLSKQVAGDTARLCGWLTYALKDDRIKSPVGLAVSKTREGTDPPAAPKLPYPTFKGVGRDGELVFESA